MDCEILKSDIENLKSKYIYLSSELEKITETGIGKTAYLDATSEAVAGTDQLLEKYFSDFIEQNPYICSWSIDKDKDDFEDPWDNNKTNRNFVNSSIYVIDHLSDESLLIGGSVAPYKCSIDDQGRLKFDEKIEGFLDSRGNEARMFVSAPLPGGGVLVGGSRGALYEFQDVNGRVVHGPRIWHGNKDIMSVSILSEKSALVCDSEGTIIRYAKDQNGDWYSLPVSILNAGTDPTSTKIATVLPNGKAIVACSGGTIHECSGGYGVFGLGPRINEPDDRINIFCCITALPDNTALIGLSEGRIWQIGEDNKGAMRVINKIEGVCGEDGFRADINAIQPLSDKKVLIGGGEGALYELNKDGSGHWKLSPRIGGFTDANGEEESIFTILPLSGNEAVIGGFNKGLHIASKPRPTFEILKNSLDQIIAQGAEHE